MPADATAARLRPLVVSPDDSLGTAAKTVLNFHLQALIRQQAAATRGEVEPIHQLRVATRRMRAALRFFRGLFSERSIVSLRHDLGWLARAVGAVRDLDVIEQVIAKHASKLDAALAANLAPVRQSISERRTAAHAELKRVLASSRYRRLLASVSSVRPRGKQSAESLGSAAPDRLRPLIRSIRRAGKSFGTDSPPEAVHLLRVRAKRLRYALEILRMSGNEALRRTLDRLERMQDTLGKYHDLTTAISWLQARAESGPLAPATILAVGALIHVLQARASKLKRRSLKAWKRFAAAQPSRRMLRELRVSKRQKSLEAGERKVISIVPRLRSRSGVAV
jgi:CHAD domain-containing protein